MARRPVHEVFLQSSPDRGNVSGGQGMARTASGKARLLMVILLAGASLAVTPGALGRERARGNSRPPMLVTLLHHHSTRGIVQHALPILAAAGAHATLAVMILELPRTMVPPDDVSQPDQPGGMGNIQPLSLGEPDEEGLWAGRLYREQPDHFMTEEELRNLVAAGWELAFHGADHTPQTALVEQVDGPAKLARAYAATKAEIRRILQDPTYPIRTNTLASNAWSAAVRQVAAVSFDWSEVAWNGSNQHVPVVFSSSLDPHGDLNSVTFQRDTFEELPDIQDLVSLARTGGGGWLIIQVHDVVERLEDSPDPPRAMLVDEYRLMVESLAAAGVRFVTFSEGAEMIQHDADGNLIRNSLFARNPFKILPDFVRLDWTSSTWGDENTSLEFQNDGTLRLAAQVPSRLTATQRITPALSVEQDYVLRLAVDLSDLQGGVIRAGLRGPAGERMQALSSYSKGFCMEFPAREVAGAPPQAGPVEFLIATDQFTGTATLGDISLQARQSGVKDCRITDGRVRR